MLIKYTTKIEASQSLMEIQEMLSKGGAYEISVQYDAGKAIAVVFRLSIAGEMTTFRLPSRSAGVFRCLKLSKAPKKIKTWEQAERIAWRILRTWIEAQLALVELQMADAQEVFLPYAQLPGGQTFYNHMKNRFKLLGEGRL